jgi:hypothetical protein
MMGGKGKMGRLRGIGGNIKMDGFREMDSFKEMVDNRKTGCLREIGGF